jgi:hypothetical protein
LSIYSPSQAQLQVDEVQQTSGTKRKRRAPTRFDDRFIDLMAFKAKYGHCDVSQRGENASLGQWCSKLRSSYKKMENKKKPHTKLSDEQIQCLNDAGFNWSLVRKVGSAFDDRFNDLMTFKAKYGHCDVYTRGEDASLGKWCTHLRGSYKKMENKKKPLTTLSDEQIQRLNDAGFKWSLQKESSRLYKKTDDRFNDLMAAKAKFGHCEVSYTGENASL